MFASNTLDQSHLLGCLLIAALVGGFTGSLLIFVFTFFVLTAAVAIVF